MFWLRNKKINVRYAPFFLKNNFFKILFRNTITVSDSLDPEQVRQNVRPALGPNGLQRFSADNICVQMLKHSFEISIGRLEPVRLNPHFVT